MENSQTTVEIETHPPKPLTFDPIKPPDDDAQSFKPVGGVKTEIQTEPPESTNLPDDDGEIPVGGIGYPKIQIYTLLYFQQKKRSCCELTPWVKKKLLQTFTLCASIWMFGQSQIYFVII